MKKVYIILLNNDINICYDMSAEIYLGCRDIGEMETIIHRFDGFYVCEHQCSENLIDKIRELSKSYIEERKLNALLYIRQ